MYNSKEIGDPGKRGESAKKKGGRDKWNSGRNCWRGSIKRAQAVQGTEAHCGIYRQPLRQGGVHDGVEAGDKVQVSESTVVRFAIALGYDGYPALQKALQEMIRTRLTAVQRVEMTGNMSSAVLGTVFKADMQNIRQTIEDLDEANFSRTVDALCEAERVYVVGVRSSAPLAQFLGYYMNFIRDNVMVITSGISDVLEQVARVGERTWCWASRSRGTRGARSRR